MPKMRIKEPEWILIIIVSLLSNAGPRRQNLGHLNWKTHRKEKKKKVTQKFQVV